MAASTVDWQIIVTTILGGIIKGSECFTTGQSVSLGRSVKTVLGLMLLTRQRRDTRQGVREGYRQRLCIQLLINVLRLHILTTTLFKQAVKL